MKTFKTFIAENMDHDKDSQAVPELKAALLANKEKINSASEKEVYGIIDKIMTRIAKSHGLSGQKLHDMWVKKYKQIPDTWIMNENLHQWFKDKWVRFGPDGKIRGDCARGSESEGKPKCLPQAKAHALGKKGRASAAARKRREDPNPERSGKAINVATKKNEEHINEKKDACYYQVKSRYKVWPSAYASGALVKCRKKKGQK
jgi:hypothetical protein